MKRRVIQLVVLLLLGAIVNVAVAWALYEQNKKAAPSHLTSDYHYTLSSRWITKNRDFNDGEPRTEPIQKEGPFDFTVEKRLGETSIALLDGSWSSRERSPRDLRTSTLLASLPTTSRLRDVDDFMDWISLEYGRFFQERLIGIPFLSISVLERGQGLSYSSIIYERAFPDLKIFWLGFAINTIFYAAMLCVLFFAPAMVKRSLRRRRGLCPACAYPWGAGTSPVCTECGAALKPQATLDQ